MDLRTRILVGYAYLVSLIVVGAVAAALGFHHLGSRLAEVLDENFASVRWSMEMVDALERQDSAVLAALLGDGDAVRAINVTETSFIRALDSARANVTVDREAEVIDEVDRSYGAYQGARDRLLSRSHDHPLAAYNEEAFPRFVEAKRSVVELLEVNHRAMIEADEAARAAARRRAAGHGVVVVLALLSFVWMSRALGRDVLVRLANLKSVAQSMAAGDLDRRADATRSDELGLLAEQLNALLDRQAELRGRNDARLAGVRDLVLGLLEARGAPCVLFAPDGRLVGATLEDREVGAARSALASVRSGGASDGSRFEVCELHVGPRPVGWLVTRI
ncbi:MAG: HAMP domain-containing protein [Thermoanaerobaculales bacterium]|jgi:HAMP domain-containing protein|nr:HAMP domain-containing protein [Thermoanaerobaculales bacterium]